MMWTYSRLIISEEDYYKASKPKKILCAFGAVYTSACVSIWATKQANPEKYFKQILLSPFIIPAMAIAPIAAVYLFNVKQKAIYLDIYQNTVGHLSDREMLELECKINPNRRLIYDVMIVDTEESDGKKEEVAGKATKDKE